MTSSDAGATSSSIISLIVLSPMPTFSLALSLTLSPVSTTSGILIHRPFASGLLRRSNQSLTERLLALVPVAPECRASPCPRARAGLLDSGDAHAHQRPKDAAGPKTLCSPVSE